MINKKIGVLLLFALLISFGAKAQRATSMRINEVFLSMRITSLTTMANVMAGLSCSTLRPER